MKENINQFIKIIKELNYIFTSKQKKNALMVLVIILFSSFLELIGVTIILPFIQTILSPQELFENPLVGPIIDYLNISDPKEMMLWCGIGIIFLYLVKNLFMIWSYWIQFDFATKVRKQISVKMLSAYMNRPYVYFLSANSAEILRGCNTDTMNVYEIVSYMFTLITEFVTITLIGGAIIWTEPGVALGILLLLVIVMLGMFVLFKPIAKRAGDNYRLSEMLKNKEIYQTVGGVKDIYVLQRKRFFIERFDNASDIARKALKANGVLSNCPERIVEGICVSGLIGVICVRLLLDNNMVDFVPKLAMFAMASFKILPSLGKITSRINGIVYCRQSLNNVYNIMKEAEQYNAEQQEYISSKTVEDCRFTNNITINNIYWKYENRDNPVLLGADLIIEKGQSIALIGTSGSGKTTLVDIILGLLKPQEGIVLMDGIDIFSIPEKWAQIVGYVPQSVFLLDDTIRNNIAFGIPENEIDDEIVWEALERAQLKEFVNKLPNGLDTIVGERGVQFSGGQRQRISIARALYNRPQILVLDEATAALDGETEKALMEAVEALQGQITMIIVAHRLTTISKCDKIYEIVEGRAKLRAKEEVLVQ